MIRQLCAYCFKEIDNGVYKIVPLERPYLNIIFHKECYAIIESNEADYIELNIEKIIKSYAEYEKHRKK